MIHRALFWPTRFVWLPAFLFLVGLGRTDVLAGELKVEVQLVWGTNEDKSPDPKHKPLAPDLAKRLSMLKWKKYFQVNRQVVAIPSRKTQRIKLSPQCEIDITELEGPRVEVKIYGRTAEAAAKNEPLKSLRKETKQLTKDELLVFAGNDKNDCAWAIVIKQVQ